MTALPLLEPQIHQVPTRPKGKGLWSLGTGSTLLVLVLAALGMLIALFINKWGGGIWLLLSALTTGLLLHRDKHDRTLIDGASDRVSFRRRKRLGHTSFRPGALTPLGSHLLPGVLSRSILTEATDVSGQAYAVLTYPDTGHHVIAFNANPDGVALVDATAGVTQLAKFDEWLAGLGHEADLEQAMIEVNIAPDAGPALIREVNSQADPDAPEISRELLEQIKTTYPLGASTTRAYVSMTFRNASTTTKAQIKADGGVEAITTRLGARLPQIRAAMAVSGAGTVTSMTGDDFIQVGSITYDPATRLGYQALHALGEDRPVRQWDSIAVATEEDWSWLYHGDRASSCTWERTAFTNSGVTPQSLAPILRENPDIDVLRVTWRYRPINPAVTGGMTESDYNNAEHRVSTASKPTARDKRAMADADRTRILVAHQAGLLRSSMLVTATVLGDERQPLATAAVEYAGPASRMLLREMNGFQAQAFAAGCAAFGIVPEAHLSRSTRILKGTS